jgi:hypothetical protein
MINLKKAILSAVAGLAFAGAASAADIDVTANITGSDTWTADNVYNLTTQIYVEPGATLTIEAGTVVASAPTINGSGSLAVCRGAQIHVMGEPGNPVIMTSTNDTATWAAGSHPGTGLDPKSGTWREACNEWGNLTLMGNAIIAYGDTPAGSPDGTTPGTYDDQSKYPNVVSEATMEGLTTGVTYDQYGGDDDNDDSGQIHYLSLRYGGRVVGLTNELNGMSLGGIGRETEIDHVEIMNNVDDGIEIWGGTVELKYVSIWNIGDDSFDIDQGWRGKAQFGLIVQGYSTDDAQGSGVGDNCFETDGAEDSDAQPVTTGAIYNFTVLGQEEGDGATVWRDNARIQYRKCMFIEIGEKVVRPDNIDGDGAQGYGINGSHAWGNAAGECWATAWDTYPTWMMNGADPLDYFQSQSAGDSDIPGQGYVCELTDSVFYDCADYNEMNAVGELNTATPTAPHYDANTANQITDALPIKTLVRETPVVKGGKVMARVTNLNPCADDSNAHIWAVGDESVPAGDSFFHEVPYRGAFTPTRNWLECWTAAEAFGLTDVSGNVDDPAASSDVGVGMVVEFETVNGVIYTVEKSDDMVNWELVEVVVGDGSTMSVIDANTAPAAYYRVRE